MIEIKERIAERERVLKLKEKTAQRYWAMWKLMREQTSDLMAEIEQLKEEIANE